jgi:hypothetical protein
VVQSSSSATVRPLARMSGRGDRECAHVVCSKRRKERKGECGVVVGRFNGRGGREKEKGGVQFGTRHAAGGAGEGRGGLAQRSGSTGWLAPAQSRCARVGGAPRCTTGAAGWLSKGPRPQSRAAAVKFDLKSNSNRFKIDPNHSNFDRLKNDLLSSKFLN